ncbi:chitinase [Trametes meyenii]|nr:chitinase [Trametes meyenii]
MSFSRLLSLCSALASLSLVCAAPHARRAQVPSGPKFVIYTDAPLDGGNVLPPLDQIEGFNVVNLAFLLTAGPADQAKAWADLPADQRQKLKQQYNGAGVSLVVSAFGESDIPTQQDPATVANTLSTFVLNTDLDGIDVDYEDTVTISGSAGVGEAWLTTLTQTLRQKLPQGQFILSHAPLAPWFLPNANPLCPGGGYLTVDKNVGSLIDFYNIQFYNQSPSPGYDNCDTLISTGDSSVLGMMKQGLDQSKLVIGKPGTQVDVTNGGFIDPATLNTCVQQAVAGGWKAGIMAFQFPHADNTWLSTVKGSALS